MGEYMKKIKEIWDNNRILFILSFIILACLVTVAIVCVTMFFGGNKSPYGDRLDGMEEHALKDEDKEGIISKLKESDTVTNVDVRTQGKIIYIRIEFNNVTLDRAKEIAGTALEVINDDYKSVYDIHYTLISAGTEEVAGFTIMGAKNINRSIIVWNNNNPMPEPSTEE